MMKPNNPPRENHLIITRYFCALSILFAHSSYLFTETTAYHTFVNHFIRIFPGVPLLLFVSGFLVSMSYKYSSDFISYLIKRILRIYPTLWVSVIISTIILLVIGQMQITSETWFMHLVWLVSQATVLPIYNPDVFRDYGVGVVNGSLWVIPVIFQFYLFLPLLVRMDNFFTQKYSSKWIFYFLALAGLVNICFWYGFDHDTVIFKVLRYVTIVPWLYVFLLGYIFQRNYRDFKFDNKIVIVILLSIHLVLYIIKYKYNLTGVPHGIDPISLLILTLFFLNFSFLPLSSYGFVNSIEKFLSKNDVTLGVFIFQMVVANLMIEFVEIQSGFLRVLVFMVGTVILAFVSTKYLETPIRNSRDSLIAVTKKILGK